LLAIPSSGFIRSILRSAAFFKIDGIGPTADVTWTAIPLAIYSNAAASVYFTTTCIPSYRSLYLTIRRPKKSQASYNSKTPARLSWRRKTPDDDNEEGEIPLSSQHIEEK
jgi:hypothetical protein